MKQNIYIAALLAGMLALAGCGGGSSVEKTDPPKVDPPASAVSVKFPDGGKIDPMAVDLEKHGESATITIEADDSKKYGNVVFECPEAGGDCKATFENELGNIVVKSTGGLTAGLELAASAGTIGDPTATVSGTTGTANSGPVMLVREKRDWNGDEDETTSWGIVVKSGTKESAATFNHGGNTRNNVTPTLSAGWKNTTSNEADDTEDLISFSAVTNAQTKALAGIGESGEHSTLDGDRDYMILGAWVIYPNPALSDTGKVAYASKPLGSDGMALLGQYKTAKGTAIYQGAAAGVTVTSMDDDPNNSIAAYNPKYTYTPWSGGSATLTANFDTMKIHGFIVRMSSQTLDTSPVTKDTGGNIPLTAIDIGSNYKASGNITVGESMPRDGTPAKNVGTWDAEFVQDGAGIIGTFDRTGLNFGKKVTATGNSAEILDTSRYYGAFGATTQ